MLFSSFHDQSAFSVDRKGELYYDFPTKIPDIRLFYVTLKQMKMNKNDQDKTIKIFYVLFGQIRVLPDLQSIVKSHLVSLSTVLLIQLVQ